VIIPGRDSAERDLARREAAKRPSVAIERIRLPAAFQVDDAAEADATLIGHEQVRDGRVGLAGGFG
jgi:hypothetical protein